MNLPKLSFHNLVNLSLAVFLLIGIAATTFAVANLTPFESNAQAHGNPPPIYFAVLTVSPVPVLANSTFSLTGARFTPNTKVTISIKYPDGTVKKVSPRTDYSDSSGNIDATLTSGASGYYTITAYEPSNVPASIISFQVQ